MTATHRNRAVRLAQARYPISVTWDDESDAWVAEVTDLPGCIGAGETEEEAIRIARDFSVDWIEDALDKGEPVPQPCVRQEASGKFLARVPKSLHAKLQRVAEAEGVSQNHLVVSLLAQSLAEREIRGGVARFSAELSSIVDGTREILEGFTAALAAFSGGAALFSDDLIRALPGVAELLGKSVSHGVEERGVSLPYGPRTYRGGEVSTRWEDSFWDDPPGGTQGLGASVKGN